MIILDYSVFVFTCSPTKWWKDELISSFKVAPKSGQSPCTIIVHGFGPNFTKNKK